MAISAIHSEAEFVEAVDAIDALWDVPDGSPEVAELGRLSMLVEVYETNSRRECPF